MPLLLLLGLIGWGLTRGRRAMPVPMAQRFITRTPEGLEVPAAVSSVEVAPDVSDSMLPGAVPMPGAERSVFLPMFPIPRMIYETVVAPDVTSA